MSPVRMLSLFIVSLLIALPAQAGEFLVEDVNFALDSDTVIDDTKQLPKFAALLKADSNLILQIDGHTDDIGSERYNQTLSEKRAGMVKDLLVDMGVSPDQLVVKGHGYERPKAEKTDRDARLTNRRASFSLYKMINGTKDFYLINNTWEKPLSTSSAVVAAPVAVSKKTTASTATTAAAPETGQAASLASDEILKRLVDLQEKVDQMSEAPMTRNALTAPASASLGSRGQAWGALGADDDEFAGSIGGRILIPFGKTVAFQGGLQGMITDIQKEFQIDSGIAATYSHLQMGAFASVKYAKLHGFNDAGLLSQMGFSAAWLLDNGSIGAFFTEAMNPEDTIMSVTDYVGWDLRTTETYLKVRDRAGVNFRYIFDSGLSAEGDLGVVHADDHEFAGGLKIGYPLKDDFRIFIMGSGNSGLLTDDDDDTFIMAGVELGGWYNTRPAADDIRPMYIPDLSYEVKTRVTLVDVPEVEIPECPDCNCPEYPEPGNSVPQVTLSGSSNSVFIPAAVTFTASAADSDGTIESYQWNFGDGTSEVGGASVSHTFTKAGSFLVTVTATDNDGGQASAATYIHCHAAPFIP